MPLIASDCNLIAPAQRPKVPLIAPWTTDVMTCCPDDVNVLWRDGVMTWRPSRAGPKGFVGSAHASEPRTCGERARRVPPPLSRVAAVTDLAAARSAREAQGSAAEAGTSSCLYARHRVVRSSGHLVIVSSCHHVVISSCHHVVAGRGSPNPNPHTVTQPELQTYPHLT